MTAFRDHSPPRPAGYWAVSFGGRGVPMLEDLCFLRAVLNRPEDDTLRLVYADWLDERGDPRGRFLRLDVERQRPAASPAGRQAALAKQVADLTRRLDARWVGWVCRTRNPAPGVRLDLALVGDGTGRIEVRGGEQEAALLVDGRPVALNWDDCAGSVGQYLVFTGRTRGDDHARALAAFVEGEPDPGRPLSDQVGPLLAAFAPGTYGLWYTPPAAAGTTATFGHPGGPSAGGDLGDYYPADDRNLVCTQPPGALDAARVGYFRDQIRAGRRPTVVTATAEGAWCEFVIDGHHKLEAYSRQRVKPALLSIVRWDAPGISLEEGVGFLPPGHRGVGEYHRMKGYAAG